MANLLTAVKQSFKFPFSVFFFFFLQFAFIIFFRCCRTFEDLGREKYKKYGKIRAKTAHDCFRLSKACWMCLQNIHMNILRSQLGWRSFTEFVAIYRPLRQISSRLTVIWSPKLELNKAWCKPDTVNETIKDAWQKHDYKKAS